MGGSYQQEVDLMSLYKDVASDYIQMVTVPEQLPNVLDRAIRTALTRRAPTAVIIPPTSRNWSTPHRRTSSRWCRPVWGSSGPTSSRRRQDCSGPPTCSTPENVSPCSSAAVHAGRSRR
ncbi:thiamine pyrophosphate enzyme, N-terminal TPP binding domain protein [Mycobacterium xenopi 3993]|nr:thiamine pyrophosphate enzyme, N-terminal TPP binding domain protein [Mycobacterium xenopi 3993]